MPGRPGRDLSEAIELGCASVSYSMEPTNIRRPYKAAAREAVALRQLRAVFSFVDLGQSGGGWVSVMTTVKFRLGAAPVGFAGRGGNKISQSVARTGERSSERDWGRERFHSGYTTLAVDQSDGRQHRRKGRGWQEQLEGNFNSESLSEGGSP